MSLKFKVPLYVLLGIATLLFGYFAVVSYQRLMASIEENSGSTAAETTPGETAPATRGFEGYSHTMTFGVLFFISLVGLGFLLGYDVSQGFGNKTVKFLYNDEGEGMQDPEYDRAEQAWADGHHLEAIELMREYLKKNPRQVHAAVRIAEIYEKDLLNPLAAALEYEEVLERPLPPDRWGWHAIHLCNLYFKLGQQDKAIALLRRIDAEFGETPAAEKARKRLAMYEEEGALPPQLAEEPPPAKAAEPPPTAGPPQAGELPPGFKLKRG